MDLRGLPCDWHIMPFDGGNVDWSEVKRGIRESGYQGLFSYEVVTHAPLEIKKIQAKYLLECYKAYFEY